MFTQRISVILPVYNEESIIADLASEIEKQVDAPLEFVFINDGSEDNTLEVLKNYEVRKRENRKKIVNLSRNFGHQTALIAGLSSVPDKIGRASCRERV